jgi:hypothetical protein
MYQETITTVREYSKKRKDLTPHEREVELSQRDQYDDEGNVFKKRRKDAVVAEVEEEEEEEEEEEDSNEEIFFKTVTTNVKIFHRRPNPPPPPPQVYTTGSLMAVPIETDKGRLARFVEPNIPIEEYLANGYRIQTFSEWTKEKYPLFASGQNVVQAQQAYDDEKRLKSQKKKKMKL